MPSQKVLYEGSEIYFTRSKAEYRSLIKRAIIHFCAAKYNDPDDETVTAFTCSELLAYFDKMEIK